MLGCTGAGCSAGLVCPPGEACSFLCTGAGACSPALDCTSAARCNIDCNGAGSCPKINAGNTPTTIFCNGGCESICCTPGACTAMGNIDGDGGC